MSNATDPTSPIDAAVEYARKGWRVIQLHNVGPDGTTCSCNRGGNCTSKGKHPVDNAWQNNPPLSTPDIYALWETRPKANVGIATGRASGFFVIDLDPKDDGIENFRLLKGDQEFPQTYTVRTGSGGYHYFFAMPEDFDVRNSQSKLAPGVDVRGSGGQVVAAPSRTDKGVYTVSRDVPVASAPRWILDLLRKDQPSGEVITAEDLPKPEDIDPAEWDRLNAYARKAIDANLAELKALARDGWDGKPWDATTFTVACALIEIANSPWNSYSLGQAKADLMANAPRDNEGFDDWKVNQKFESALERVGDKARAIPEGRPKTLDEDPLFSGDDVEDRSANPTEGGAGDGGLRPLVGNPEDFFNHKGSMLASRLAHAVSAMGPVGWGEDKSFWRYEHGVWRPDEDVVKHRMIDLLGDDYRDGQVKTIESIVAKRAYPITGSKPDERYLNFANGMLEWRTGVLHEHSPSYCSTVQFPVAYEPDAECPTFDAFLHDVMHEDYVYLAWQMLGYLMYSGNPLQRAFLFYGSGGNGKGTLMRVIEDLLGSENIATESLDDLNGNRFSAINLYGRIANLAGDIDATYQESTANFKKLTGEDTYAGEHKFGKRFNFRSWAVPVFSANKIPGSSDVTEGYLRRWVVLHFHKRITNRIPGFSDTLSRELPGIAAKAVRHIVPLMDAKDFHIRGEAKKAQEELADTVDQVRQWLKGAGTPGAPQIAPGHHAPVTELYASYKIWADASGLGKVRMAEFQHRLEGLGYPLSRVAGVLGFTGLKPHATSSSPSDNFF